MLRLPGSLPSMLHSCALRSASVHKWYYGLFSDSIASSSTPGSATRQNACNHIEAEGRAKTMHVESATHITIHL